MNEQQKRISEALKVLRKEVVVLRKKSNCPELQPDMPTRAVERSFNAVPEPEPEPIEPPPAILEIVEVRAEFPGGMAVLKEYLKTNLSLPESVISGTVYGKCYVQFVVSAETGAISNVTLRKGMPDCEQCDKEAIRVVKNMPNWIPAKNNGKPVDSYFNLPIVFKADQ